MRKATKIWTLAIILVLSLGVFGIWSVASDSTTPTYEAELKTIVNGNVTTKTGTFKSLASDVIKPVSTDTEFEITIYKDLTNATISFPNPNTSTADVKLTVFLNGHTITHTGGIFTLTSNMSTESPTKIDFYLYGGKTPEDTTVGKLYGNGGSGAVVYTHVSRVNASSTVTLKNIDMIQTKCDDSFKLGNTYGDQPMFHFQTGTVNMENVNITYTGEDAVSTNPEKGDISNMKTEMIRAYNNTNLHMKNCTLTDTNTKGIQTRGIGASSTKGSISLENVKINGTYLGIEMNQTAAKLALNNCEIASKSTPLKVAAKTTVTDTVITVADGVDTINGGSNVTFMYGTGKTMIITTDGRANIGGTYSTEDGYSLGTSGAGKFILGHSALFTSIKMPTVFSNDMVFQKGEPINVYGFCETDGNTVKVVFDGEERETTVVDGEWFISFPARDYAKGLTFSVTEIGVEYPAPITFTNVDIGEVWVMSGQSNAQYVAYHMEDFDEYLKNADNFGDDIRFFTNPSSWSVNVMDLGAGAWRIANSKNLPKSGGGDFSAIAYVMATKLAMDLPSGVTIAVIDAAYGGSSIQAWTEEHIYKEMVSTTDTHAKRLDAYRDFYNKHGRYPNSKQECPEYFVHSNGQPDGYRNILSSCYNVMLAQLGGYKVHGVIWFQGENAVQSSGTSYYRQYEALTTSYRTLFDNENLPFFVIQIHPFGNNVSKGRTIQYQMVLNDRNSHIVTAILEGNVFSSYDINGASSNITNSLIHPCVKSPVGQRLADSILFYEYGIGTADIMKAPEILSISADGASAVVTFDTDLYTFYGDELVGFEIAGADGNYYAAKATIVGNKVILTSDSVSAPTKVRYAYTNVQCMIELADGTVFEYAQSNQSTANDGTDRLTVVAPDGTKYTFIGSDNDVIRTFIPGNLTNASGYPTPVFELEVGYEAD